ncbi:MAG TPA: efflux RND transporter periplasmic adaptor subunit [Tepidisphaeraceae bacterium]|nr:efflux RND transporter periplasmic adaptor subunit [Tepidisphaeraceae bacterium]
MFLLRVQLRILRAFVALNEFMDSDLEKLRIHKDHKARRNERPVWPWVVLVILLIGAGAAALQWRSASATPVVQVIRVRIPEGAVTDNDLVALNATGYIMAAHKIELASKVLGRVAWIGVEMGDKVIKGEVIVRLEDDEYKARVAQQQGLVENAQAKLDELEAGSRAEEIGEAMADLEQARADFHNAETNYNRLKALQSTSTISSQEFDDATSLLNARKAQVDARQQRLNMIKAGPRKEQIAAQRATVRQLQGALAQSALDLENTVIRAPMDSTILSRNVEVGEFVTTGFVGDRGAKGYVVSLADLNDLRVELDISQNDFSKVSSQQPCWITTDAYPDRKYDGQVDLISPEANRQKATVQVRVKVLKPDELLKPDMNATVSFLSPKKLASTQAAASVPADQRLRLTVPASAMRDGGVFVVEAGKAVKRGVTVAGQPNSNGEVEVRKGLIGGEDLIVAPPDTLKDGDAVKIQKGAN